MKTMRIGLVTLIGGVAGFALQSCFAPQPPFECNVQSGFYVKLTKVSGDAPCGDLNHINMGMARYHPPNTNTFDVRYRASPLVDISNGEAFSADISEENNCTNEESCEHCIISATGSPDGGVLTKAGPVVCCDFDGGACVESGLIINGACEHVELGNECESHEDPISRADPTDPGPQADGRCPGFNEPCPKKAIGEGSFPPLADKNGLCEMKESKAATLNFGPVSETLVDGGPFTLPALPVKLEWKNFLVYNHAKIPQTAWKADLTYTMGSCVANYKAIGIWPEIHCSARSEMPDGGNDACDPNPRDPKLPDGGLDPRCGLRAYGTCALGSGINPNFKPVCDLTRGVCLPSVDLDSLKP